VSGGLFGDEPEESTTLAEPGPNAPLAERMRPRALEDMVGQGHLVDEEGFVPRLMAGERLQSLILWGPPGTGKTTLARILAQHSDLAFQPFSAVLSGIADIKKVMQAAEQRRRRQGRATLLFVDEIATTENPSFEVNSALLSRARVLVLKPLEEEHLIALLERALADERGLNGELTAIPKALVELARAADGDARRSLTLLETCALLAGPGGELTPQRAAQERAQLRRRRDGLLADAHARSR
jgi:putative ATPase